MVQDGHIDEKDDQKGARLSEIHLGWKELAGMYDLNRSLL
jgi:hypothetical protein